MEAERPDALLVDVNCWGASAAAEASGLPWALFMTYLLRWRLWRLPRCRGWVRGSRRARTSSVASATMVVGPMVPRLVNRGLPRMNALRFEVAPLCAVGSTQGHADARALPSARRPAPPSTGWADRRFRVGPPKL